MKYGYYPGCSLEGISLEYDHSIRSLFKALNITIEELPDWICCGTLAAPSISRMVGLTTPLWNIAKAGQEGYDRLIAPCSACVYHFRNAAAQLAGKPHLQREVETVLEMPLTGAPPAIHPLELLDDETFKTQIKAAVCRDLAELKVVCYYGCHISRPADIMQFDDPEAPQSMDQLMSLVGAQPLEWPGKVECCGAQFSLIKPSIVIDLCTRLFQWALEAGADAIVVACPMCHANLDTRQDEVAQRLGTPLNLPVLYFSQVLGYAMGLQPDEIGFKKHIIDPVPLMLEKCRSFSSETMIDISKMEAPV